MARMKQSLTNLCDIGKCIAYCTSSCENQCDTEDILDSTSPAYLEEIGWAPNACDLDASKAKMKKMCEGAKAGVAAGGKTCDANCDGAGTLNAVQILFVVAAVYLGRKEAS